MTWNYRVMSHPPQSRPDGQGETWFAIHEVFYKDSSVKDTKVTSKEVSYTQEPITIEGTSIEKLRQTLLHMLAALDKPVLEYK